MKVVFFVDQYAGRAVIRPDWQRMFFFSGRQPEYRSFVCIESPKLRGISADHVRDWLQKESGSSGAVRETLELPDHLWRAATLDDWIDADNYQYSVYHLVQAFSVGDFTNFSERWSAPVSERARDALSELVPKKRAQRLHKLEPFAARVYSVLGQLSSRASHEREQILEQLESESIEKLKQATSDLSEWIEQARSLTMPKVAIGFMLDIAQELVKPAISSEQVQNWVERLYNDSATRNWISMAPGFWTALQRKLPFEANVRDISIDITRATEVNVTPSWELWRARRIGKVTIGRRALFIEGGIGQSTFVRGERKLKFAVAKAGGELKKYGCVLTMQADTGRNLSSALLEVERIDALANVAPEKLRERLEKLGLPASHLAWRALARTAQDPRQARILADILIEYALGVDADIARKLARAQSVGRRTKH